MPWFGVKACFVVLPDGSPEENLQDDRILLVEATDAEAAYRRALDLGAAAESEYESASGNRVRVRLMEIVRVFAVEGASLDGAEVYGELGPLDTSIGFDTRFDPDAHTPQGL